MKDVSSKSAQAADAAAARHITRELQLDADGSVVILEEGEPCLPSSVDAAAWDWDMESVASGYRCQECGSAEKVVREPDGRIVCEACLLRGPAPAAHASRAAP